jgi:hypothetical protein
MEHMLTYQQIDLEKAATLFVLYAVGLVSMHCGFERAQAVIEFAQAELDNEQVQKAKEESKKQH